MPKVRFTGKILPSAFHITINNPPSLNWKIDGVDVGFVARIVDDAVSVECELENFSASQHLTELYRRALDIARASVDLIAFATGHGVTVILDEFTDADGNKRPLVPADASVVSLCTAFALNRDFDDVLKIVLSEPPIFFALRELIETITLPHVSTVNCARAVETLRTLFAPTDEERGRGWAELREALNLSESFLRPITDASRRPRHGAFDYVGPEVTIDITQRAWTVMNRFLEYRKNGNRKLPLADFPVLS